MRNFLASVGAFFYLILYRIKRNPALIGAAAVWAFDALNTGDALTWHTAVIVVVGFLVRSQVVPASEVARIGDVIEGFVTSSNSSLPVKLPDERPFP